MRNSLLRHHTQIFNKTVQIQMVGLNIESVVSFQYSWLSLVVQRFGVGLGLVIERSRV